MNAFGVADGRAADVPHSPAVQPLLFLCSGRAHEQRATSKRNISVLGAFECALALEKAAKRGRPALEPHPAAGQSRSAPGLQQFKESEAQK